MWGETDYGLLILIEIVIVFPKKICFFSVHCPSNSFFRFPAYVIPLKNDLGGVWSLIFWSYSEIQLAQNSVFHRLSWEPTMLWCQCIMTTLHAVVMPLGGFFWCPFVDNLVLLHRFPCRLRVMNCIFVSNESNVSVVKVHLDPTWHVMAGGASLETGLQKQREVRILEAVYPRPSSIPDRFVPCCLDLIFPKIKACKLCLLRAMDVFQALFPSLIHMLEFV